MQGQSDDFRKVLRVFIASPGDLGEERRLFRDIVDEVNRSKANGMGMQLEPLGWEDTLPGSGRPQELINEDVKKCDLMIMLLWKRWGTPTGEYSSGFEEEYELAKRLLDEEGAPEIMLYFRKIPDDMLADPGEQLKQVQKFKEKIESERKFLYKSYEDENRWEKIFREHLSKWLDKLPLDGNRTEDSIEDQKRLKESETEIQRLKAELETEKQNSQTKIRTLALTLGIEAIEKADSGQITKAEEYFAKSIANYPNPSVINSYGLFLYQIGMLENAEERFLQVEKIGEETDDYSLVAIAYGNLGNVYRTQGDVDRAEEMHEKSLAIYEELDMKEGVANQHGNLGNVYLIRDDLDKAEGMYEKSLLINKDIGRKEGAASDYSNLGLLYQIRGDLDKAEELYRKSLELAISVGSETMIKKLNFLIDGLKQGELMTTQELLQPLTVCR
jgi:tetratricopeptide (TPR) repeat protein